MLKSHASVKRIGIVTYNPLPLWLNTPLREVRRGMRQLVADKRIFDTSRAANTTRFRQETTQSYLKPTPDGIVAADPTPLGMVLSLIPPSIITEMDDIPAEVGTLDNYYRAGGVGENPGMALGADLTKLFTDTSVQMKWLSSLTSTSLATTLYAYMYQLANDKRVGASAKVVQQSNFFESFPLRAFGYAAALSGLAALATELPEFVDVAVREAEQSMVYQDWLKTLPLPVLMGTSIVSIDKAGFSEVYGEVDRVIALPVFDDIVSPATVPGVSLLMPGFDPYWSAISFAHKDHPFDAQTARFLDGTHQNAFASSFIGLGNVEAIARAYAYYVFELVRAVTIDMSDAIVTLKSASATYKDLWTTGGAIIKRVIDPRPKPYYSWSMPNDDDVIASMMFGHYNANYSFLPRVDAAALSEASDGKLTWDNIADVGKTFRYYEGKDERVVYADVSDLNTSLMIPVPNERVDDQTIIASTGLSGIQAIMVGYRMDQVVSNTTVINPSDAMNLFSYMYRDNPPINMQEAITNLINNQSAPDLGALLGGGTSVEDLIKWLRALSKEVGIQTPGFFDISMALAKTGMSNNDIRSWWDRQLTHKWKVISPYEGVSYDPVPPTAMWGTYHALPGMTLRTTLSTHIYQGRIAEHIAASRVTNHNAPPLPPNVWLALDEPSKLGPPPTSYITEQLVNVATRMVKDWTKVSFDDSVNEFEDDGSVLKVNMTQPNNFNKALETKYKGAAVRIASLGSHAVIINGKNLPVKKAFTVYATSIMTQPAVGVISRKADVEEAKLVEITIDSNFLQVGVSQLRKIIEAAASGAPKQ